MARDSGRGEQARMRRDRDGVARSPRRLGAAPRQRNAKGAHAFEDAGDRRALKPRGVGRRIAARVSAALGAKRIATFHVKCAVCRKPAFDARIAVFSDNAQGSARRGRARQPSPDAALRHDQAARRRHLHLDASGTARVAQGRGGRARRDESGRRDRAPDAGRAAGRALAGIRTLGQVRSRAAAAQGSSSARLHRAADVRGSDHRHRAQGDQELQAASAQPLSYPDQVPRRGAAALRRDALARVHHEGRVLVRRRQGRRCSSRTG